MTRATSVVILIIASINFGRLNKIRVKSKMSRSEKKGHGGKHTRPKKWSGARRPAGPATTALMGDGCPSVAKNRIFSQTKAKKTFL